MPSGSRAKVVERWMGGATEPVAGSTACPARTARVSNRMQKAYREFGGRPLSRFLRRGAEGRWCYGMSALAAQLLIAPFCELVIVPLLFRALVASATQDTNWPCVWAPSAQPSMRSEILQPLPVCEFGTPELQPSMTTFA